MIEMECGDLTPKQEKFCQKYCESGNASFAYRDVYNISNMKPATINRKAVELLQNGKITARVRMIQEQAKKRSEITIDHKRQWLVEIIERSLQHIEFTDPDGHGSGHFKFSANDAIRAINELNKMDGDHAASKREVSIGQQYTLAELLEQVANDV